MSYNMYIIRHVCHTVCASYDMYVMQYVCHMICMSFDMFVIEYVCHTVCMPYDIYISHKCFYDHVVTKIKSKNHGSICTMGKNISN